MVEIYPLLNSVVVGSLGFSLGVLSLPFAQTTPQALMVHALPVLFAFFSKRKEGESIITYMKRMLNPDEPDAKEVLIKMGIATLKILPRSTWLWMLTFCGWMGLIAVVVTLSPLTMDWTSFVLGFLLSVVTAQVAAQIVVRFKLRVRPGGILEKLVRSVD